MMMLLENVHAHCTHCVHLHVDILKPSSPYFNRQRAILLSALGVLARERPNDAVAYHYALGPIVEDFIRETKETAQVGM